MAAAVSSVPRLTFFANDGTPLNGGLVYTYGAGTLVAKTFYSDESKTVPISNPIVINSAGRPQASAVDTTEVNLYFTGSAKFIVKTSLGSTLYTADNIEEVAVAGGSLTFPLTVSGVTSGGLIYASSNTTIASSALLATNAPIIGKGAGTAPATVTAGNAGQVFAGVGTAGVPAFVGGMTLLHAATGTSTAAGATTVDSIAISGLTALDCLKLVVNILTTTANTAQCSLYSVTDSTTVCNIGAGPLVAASLGDIFDVTIMQAQVGNTKYLTTANGWNTDAASSVSTGAVFAATTAWTSAWTLGLRHGGVTATGTFHYTWAVYRLAGQ